MKTKFFNEILQKVADVTGLDREKILYGKCEESTDARYILIHALYKVGMSLLDIANLTCRTRQAVGYLMNNYKKSQKWMLENDLKSVLKWVESNYFSSK